MSSSSREHGWTTFPTFPHTYICANISKSLEYEHTEVMYAISTPYKNLPQDPPLSFSLHQESLCMKTTEALHSKLDNWATKWRGLDPWITAQKGTVHSKVIEFLLWIFCQREINFYYVWTIMCSFVWLGTTASAILIHTNIIIIFVTYLWNIFHNEILNSLGRSREGSDNILTSRYCVQFEYKKH